MTLKFLEREYNYDPKNWIIEGYAANYRPITPLIIFDKKNQKEYIAILFPKKNN